MFLMIHPNDVRRHGMPFRKQRKNSWIQLLFQQEVKHSLTRNAVKCLVNIYKNLDSTTHLKTGRIIGSLSDISDLRANELSSFLAVEDNPFDGIIWGPIATKSELRPWCNERHQFTHEFAI